MAKSKGKFFTIGSKRENEGQLCIVGRAITIEKAIKKKKQRTEFINEAKIKSCTRSNRKSNKER